MTYGKEIFSQFDIKIKTYDFYLPEIDFSNLKNIKQLENNFLSLKENYSSIVLCCTGPVTSGQSENFDFEPLISKLAEKYPNILFITTTQLNSNKQNIFYSASLFPKLLDIGFLSTKCQIIIGRSSGPYIYGLTKNNLDDQTKTFICFCNDEEHALFFEKHACKKIWSKNYEYQNMYDIIKTEIKNL